MDNNKINQIKIDGKIYDIEDKNTLKKTEKVYQDLENKAERDELHTIEDTLKEDIENRVPISSTGTTYTTTIDISNGNFSVVTTASFGTMRFSTGGFGAYVGFNDSFVSVTDNIDLYAKSNVSIQAKEIKLSTIPTIKNKPLAMQEYVDKLEKEITNLKASAEGKTFTYETDNTIAYTKEVPSNAMPYASLNKVGGMSYKSENLFVIEDQEVYNYGVTFTATNGTIKATGTPTNEYTGMFSYRDIKNLLKNGKTYYLWANEYGTLLIQCELRQVDGTVAKYVNTNISTSSFVWDTSIYSTCRIIVKTSSSVVNTEINVTRQFMLVESDTEPTEFKVGFNGLRDSQVTNVVSYTLTNENTLNVGDTIRYVKTPNLLDTTTNVSLWGAKGKTTNEVYRGVYNAGNNRVGIFKRYEFNYTEPYLFLTELNKVYDLKTKFGEELEITSITNVEATNTTCLNAYKLIDEKPISSTIQALTGYGLGINETYYNYIDFANKKYVQKVTKDILNDSKNYSYLGETDTIIYFECFDIINRSNASTNDNNVPLISDNINFKSDSPNNGYAKGNVITFRVGSGTMAIYFNKSTFPTITNLETFKAWLSENPITIVYAIETSIETDISNLIDDEFIEVEALGSLTFENEYSNKTTSEVTYQVKVV